MIDNIMFHSLVYNVHTVDLYYVDIVMYIAVAIVNKLMTYQRCTCNP